MFRLGAEDFLSGGSCERGIVLMGVEGVEDGFGFVRTTSGIAGSSFI